MYRSLKYIWMPENLRDASFLQNHQPQNRYFQIKAHCPQILNFLKPMPTAGKV